MIQQHPITNDSTMPKFDQIVFGMITVFGRGNRIFFNFKNPGSKFKFKCKTETALLNFLTRLERMRISPMRGPADQVESSLTPLDINVDIPSAVVLAVPRDSNMQFSKSLPAVTRKDQSTESLYRNLRYVRHRNGDAPQLEIEPFAGCKAIVFFAVQPPGCYPNGHGFNMNLDIVQQTPGGMQQLLPVLIDPDVRNPGGNGGS